MEYYYIDPGSGMLIAGSAGWLIALLLGFAGIFAAFFKKITNFIKKNKTILIIVIIIIAAIIAIYGGIMSKGSSFDKRVIILGFDGMSPNILEPMMAEGRLPNFSKLKSEGSYSKLATSNPPQSPVAWASFATGQNPGKTGIFDFITRDPKTYGLSLSLSDIAGGKPKRMVMSKSFWQYTSDEKIPTIVLTCPVTFPPDKIYGKMISGMGTPDILGTEGTFTFYTSEDVGDAKAIGGKVFHVKKSNLMIMNLLGPRVAGAGGKIEHAKALFKATMNKEADGVTIEFQDQKFELKAGEWSDWAEVKFKLRLLKKAMGIFKFYLVETDPEFKLYISPINFDPRDPFFDISYPSGYAGDLADEIGLFYTLGMPFDTWAMNEGRLTEEPFLELSNEIIREKKKMMNHELNSFEKGVFFCYFESSDIVQHMFWRYTDPDHPLYEPDAPDEYKNTIEEWYIKMDETLGEVMERLNEDDTLIVLSDHGFDTFRRAAHINTWLRENGYLALKNPGAQEGGELLKDIDWSKTKAFAIGFGAIYVNQQGRERDGIVAPGKATQDLKDEISKKIKEWRDDKYDKLMVSSVYTKEELVWGDYAASAPDLFVGFNVGYRASWQTALGAAPKGLIEDNTKKWSGDHLFDPKHVPGIVLSNKKITKDAPHIQDIAPTVLKTVGFTDEKLSAADLDGKPLF